MNIAKSGDISLASFALTFGSNSSFVAFNTILSPFSWNRLQGSGRALCASCSWNMTYSTFSVFSSFNTLVILPSFSPCGLVTV